jgi:H+/Cl- antiporter ClcA
MVDQTLYIEVGLLVVIVAGFATIGYTRRLNFERSVENEDVSKSSGISKRVIRFTAIVLLVPSIVLLSMEGMIGSEGVSALFGAIIGYMLRGFDQNDDNGSG